MATSQEFLRDKVLEWLSAQGYAAPSLAQIANLFSEAEQWLLGLATTDDPYVGALRIQRDADLALGYVMGHGTTRQSDGTYVSYTISRMDNGERSLNDTNSLTAV